MDGTYWYEKSIPKLSNFYYTTSASVFGNDPSAAIDAFDKRFKAKTGSWAPSAFPLFGYVAVQALAYAITKAGTTDGKAIEGVFDKFHKQSFLIQVTFTPTAHIDPIRPERVMQVQNGQHSVAAVQGAQKQLPLFG